MRRRLQGFCTFPGLSFGAVGFERFQGLRVPGFQSLNFSFFFWGGGCYIGSFAVRSLHGFQGSRL